ncbi:MAG: hypothetical protein RLZZ204_306 [Bacteroidota bacterium]
MFFDEKASLPFFMLFIATEFTRFKQIQFKEVGWGYFISEAKVYVRGFLYLERQSWHSSVYL